MSDQPPSPTAPPLPKPGLAYIRYVPDWSQNRLRQLLQVARQHMEGDRIPAIWLHTPGDGRSLYVVDGRDLQLVVDLEEDPTRLLDAIDDSGVHDESPSSTQP